MVPNSYFSAIFPLFSAIFLSYFFGEGLGRPKPIFFLSGPEARNLFCSRPTGLQLFGTFCTHVLSVLRWPKVARGGLKWLKSDLKWPRSGLRWPKSGWFRPREGPWITTPNNGYPLQMQTSVRNAFAPYRGQNPQNREKRVAESKNTHFPPPQMPRKGHSESKNPHFPCSALFWNP